MSVLLRSDQEQIPDWVPVELSKGGGDDVDKGKWTTIIHDYFNCEIVL